jgi:hypothetical protein
VNTPGVLSIENGGLITARTLGAGSGGDVAVVAGSISVANGSQISGSAGQGSSGRTGYVAISTENLVVGSNGLITVENFATVADSSTIQPTAIFIPAILIRATSSLTLDGGTITAASTGNVNAPAINLQFGQSLRASGGSITNAAANGSSGSIRISGSGIIWLDHSSIITSVTGESGSGGDVEISAPFLVMDTAAIQTNTANPHAFGADIALDVGTLVPSFGSLTLGGSLQVFDPALLGFNVVQSSEPSRFSGKLKLPDIGSLLLGLIGSPETYPPVGRSLCSFTQGSSLIFAGRGGPPNSAHDPLWIESEDPSQPIAEKLDSPPSDVSGSSLLNASISPCQW